LPCPWWAPPQPSRRLVACEERRAAGRTLFGRPPAAVLAYTPGAESSARATPVCGPLVAHCASDFAGPAYDEEGRLALSVFQEDGDNGFQRFLSLTL
jgi:hypothetical protein